MRSAQPVFVEPAHPTRSAIAAFALLGAMLVACGTNAGGGAVPPSAGTSPPHDASAHAARLLARLARVYEVDRGDVPVSRAVVVGIVNGSGQTLATFGRVGPNDARRPTGDTVFDVGSITKVTTGIVLAREVVANRVALAEEAQPLLPDVRLPRFESSPIRLVDLATYASGLPNMPDDWVSGPKTAPYSHEKWKAFLERTTLTSRPGAHFEYSNIGFGLLGEALAFRANTTVAALLHRDVLDPLAMHQSYVVGETPTGTHAQGFNADGEPDSEEGEAYTEGWGGLRSTANDLLALLRAYLDVGSPIQPPLREALELSLVPRAPGDEGTHVGLGWFIRDSDRVALKNGTMRGFQSTIVLDRARNVACVVLAGDNAFDTESMALDALEGAVAERDGAGMPTHDALPGDAHPAAVEWESGVGLVGWRAPAEVARGSVAYISLFFRASRPVTRDWKVFVHADAPGADHPKVDHLPVSMTGDWPVGRIVEDRVAVPIRREQPVGPLNVWLGFFRGDERMRVARPDAASQRARGPTIVVR